MQTNTLFITLMNLKFKTQKLRQSFSVLLGLIFSVLNSLFIRVMKRLFVCNDHTVIIARRMYDTFFRIPLFLRALNDPNCITMTLCSKSTKYGLLQEYTTEMKVFIVST